jgi:hypothetical protein
MKTINFDKYLRFFPDLTNQNGGIQIYANWKK